MKQNRLVDFIIIGAMKSGTTSLSYHLSQHPEIFFSRDKEPGYFNKNENWQKGIETYHKLFEGAKEGQLMGEASTMYTMAPEYLDTHKRLHDYNPHLKLIYIMRDPIERIISNYAHNYVRKRVKTDLETEVLQNESYVTRSLYYYQIKPYLETFDKDQIMLICFEEYTDNPKSFLQDICNFLSIDSSFYEGYKNIEVKNSSSKRKILADGGIGRIFSPLKKHRHYIPEWFIHAGLILFGNSIKRNPQFPIELRKILYDKLRNDRNHLEILLKREINFWKRY